MTDKMTDEQIDFMRMRITVDDLLMQLQLRTLNEANENWMEYDCPIDLIGAMLSEVSDEYHEESGGGDDCNLKIVKSDKKKK